VIGKSANAVLRPSRKATPYQGKNVKLRDYVWGGRYETQEKGEAEQWGEAVLRGSNLEKEGSNSTQAFVKKMQTIYSNHQEKKLKGMPTTEDRGGKGGGQVA